jgi:nicotinamidase-related amidase
MAVSTLDPGSALVVIDLQKGMMSYPTIHPVAAIADRASHLASAFRSRGLPVVLVNVAGRAPGRTEQQRPAGHLPGDWAELIPELDAQEGDIRITKRTWGAFANSGLESRLREAGVTEVVLCGIATSIGVESTAREAYALGFNVVLAVDAMTDTDEDANKNSIEKIFPRLGETGTTEEIIGLLQRLQSSSKAGEGS